MLYGAVGNLGFAVTPMIRSQSSSLDHVPQITQGCGQPCLNMIPGQGETADEAIPIVTYSQAQPDLLQNKPDPSYLIDVLVTFGGKYLTSSLVPFLLLAPYKYYSSPSSPPPGSSSSDFSALILSSPLCSMSM